jgi:hypothetical protein
MTDGAMPPLRDVSGERGTQPKSCVRFREPAQTTVAGELGTVEPSRQRGGGEAELDRLRHEASPGEALVLTQSLPRILRCLVRFHPFMNKKG